MIVDHHSGDYYIILHRARGWWNVQCDPQGTGIVDPDNGRSGWVPAGCLLETRVPVATAVAEAAGSASPSAVAGKSPILPLSIISTSFPGVALMDYHKKGDEELELFKDDTLRVFKRYNHWSYVRTTLRPCKVADLWFPGRQGTWWRPRMGPVMVHRESVFIEQFSRDAGHPNRRANDQHERSSRGRCNVAAGHRAAVRRVQRRVAALARFPARRAGAADRRIHLTFSPRRFASHCPCKNLSYRPSRCRRPASYIV